MTENTETVTIHEGDTPVLPSQEPQEAAGAPLGAHLTTDEGMPLEGPQIGAESRADKAVQSELDSMGEGAEEVDPAPVEDGPLVDCPEELYPCSICGQATELTRPTKVSVPSSSPVRGTLGYWHVEMQDACPACLPLVLRSSALAARNFRMTREMGYFDPMTAWLGVVIVHRIMGSKLPALDLDRATARLMLSELAAGRLARWREQVQGRTLQKVCREPFGGVDERLLADLRPGFAKVLSYRASRLLPPVKVAPPLDQLPVSAGPVSRGCLFCGVGAVEVPASTLATLDHRDASTAFWKARTYRGVAGFTCPPCSAAVVAVGAVGPTAVERALLATLKLNAAWQGGDDLGVASYADLLDRGNAPKPSATPWAHLGNLSKVRRRIASILGVD